MSFQLDFGKCSNCGENDCECDFEERPIDINCPECGGTYLGWVDQEPGLCLDCFACVNEEGKDSNKEKIMMKNISAVESGEWIITSNSNELPPNYKDVLVILNSEKKSDVRAMRHEGGWWYGLQFSEQPFAWFKNDVTSTLIGAAKRKIKDIIIKQSEDK